MRHLGLKPQALCLCPFGAQGPQFLPRPLRNFLTDISEDVFRFAIVLPSPENLEEGVGQPLFLRARVSTFHRLYLPSIPSTRSTTFSGV